MDQVLRKLPPLGSVKADIDTPALCLDLDKLERNIAAMVAACRVHGVDWRPHAKCHKSPVLAQKLVEAGALGVTCATLREAEVMAESGIDDVLIANLIAGSRKLERLVRLAQVGRPVVCVDHLLQAEAMSQALAAERQTVRVLIELEIGFNRVGVLPGAAALELAGQIDRLPGLEFAGLMAYEGHLLTIADPIEKERAIREALDQVSDCRGQLAAVGLPCPIVSCGGTGSFPITLSQPGITELQAGGAIFMDMFYREACQVETLEHALTLLATVVSRPTPTRAVMDAGRKAMDLAIHRPRIQSHEGVELDWLSAEHGILKVDPDVSPLPLGSILEWIPGYADLTNHLHQQFYGFRGEQLEQVIPIVH